MASKPAPENQKPSLKRKQPSRSDEKQPSQPRKRQKIQDARAIALQTSSKAFKDGELNVDKFIKAHEFEIKALEEGISRARKVLASRAFQSVPRDLRRRTASHNVKKVPKRLRARAGKEMREDNTPTVTARRRKPTGKIRLRNDTAKRLKALSSKAKAKPKSKAADNGNTVKTQAPLESITAKADAQQDRPTPNPNPTNIEVRTPRKKKNKLEAPPKPKAKFRKRQLNKTWLPTHLFHTKRARMTPPLEPLWRFAIPLTPTAKSYRPTHRGNVEKGAVAWDMSYVSTIGLEGTETALNGLLKAMGVGANEHPMSPEERRARLWRAGTRTWGGWLFERNGWPTKGIAPVTVIWCAKEKASDQNELPQNGGHSNPNSKKMEKRKILIRVHPSAFLQLWEEILVVAKVQKRIVSVEDLRFEIGSIEITGPSATEALLGALWPIGRDKERTGVLDQPEEVWATLGALTNPSNLPPNALLGFNVSDPRLHHPPRTIAQAQSSEAQKRLLNVLATWPPDQTQRPPSLFDRSARLVASRSLPSQKAINRRKALAPPGDYPATLPTDPKIPVLLLASRGRSNTQGSWTLLLPWKCVLPVWYSLMYYPLSSGGTIRFGGLEEKRQIAFEAGVPWFPGDVPGTRSGWAWEVDEKARRRKEWEKRPKGRRLEWENVDLGGGRKGEVGEGWSCDWDMLANGGAEEAVKGKEPGKAQVSIGNDDVGKVDKGHLNHKAKDGEGYRGQGDDTRNDSGKRDDGKRADGKGNDGKGSSSIRGDRKGGDVQKGHTSSPPIHHLPSSLAATALSAPSQTSAEDLKHAVMTVKLTLLGRGAPETCSRIYRLPTSNPKLRQKWLSLRPDPRSKRRSKASNPPRPSAKSVSSSAEPHEQLRYLAASLLEPPIQAGSEQYPEAPGQEDLIGFVTTGGFNLREGKGTGLGSLLIERVLEGRHKNGDDGKLEGKELGEERLCIVREAGMSLGRLARWEIV